MSDRKKHILFLTGTRADFGKLKPLIQKVEGSDDFSAHIFVTGMHMLARYGGTVNEIRKAGFANIYPFINQDASVTSQMDLAIANTIQGLGHFIREVQPDLIVVHGDRSEALAGAIVGAMNNILVAHVEGGEVSGTVDELIRHAVTKLSHLHFVANDEARWRLIQMGELPDSIYVIGSPDIDVMLSDDLPSLSQVRQHYDIPFSQYGICLFHPVTTEVSMLREHANALVEALQASRKNFVMIYPNNDTGSNIILDAYKALEDHPRFKIIPSMRFEFFLRLLKHAQVIIGNSSAGIREAPVYQVPTVNIGSRQRDRFHHSSIYNVSPVANKIIECLEHLPQTVTPSFYFGHGKSAELFMACLRERQLWLTSPQKIFQTLEPNLKKIAETVN